MGQSGESKEAAAEKATGEGRKTNFDLVLMESTMNFPSFPRPAPPLPLRGLRALFLGMRQHGSNGFNANAAINTQPLIYVVDDQDVLLELATLILQENGCSVRTFTEGKSALQAFAVAEPPPALVITDYSMGDMNGLELIERCRLLRPRQRTLLISGAVGEDIYRGFAFKPDAFLQKPYAAQELVHSVEALLAPPGYLAHAA